MNLGFGELVLILGIALIVFGPAKLPEFGRSLGRAIREFKRATDSLQGELQQSFDADNNAAPPPEPTATPLAPPPAPVFEQSNKPSAIDHSIATEANQ